MLKIYDDNPLNRRELLFLSFYLIIMTVEVAVEYYSGKGTTWALMLFRLLSMLTPLFAIELILQHPLRSYTYRSIVCIYFLYILMWSFPVYLEQNENVSIFSATIYFAMPLGVSLENVDAEKFKTPFFCICLIGVCCFLFTWFTYDIDISKALRRGYTWTDIFFWAGVFWAIIPIMLYSVIINSSWTFRTLTIFYWICGVIFNLIFLKRFIITDSILLLLMISVFLIFEGKFNLQLLLIGLLVAGVIVLVANMAADSEIGMLWEGVMNRFADTSVGEFDRFEESRIYFSNSNLIYIILGKGLWGGHSSLAGLHEALHVGWSNLIHKGGIILLLFVLCPTIKAIILVPHMKRLDARTKWAVSLACVYGIRLFYSNMHAHYPEMVLLFFAYAVIMNYKLPDNYEKLCCYYK